MKRILLMVFFAGIFFYTASAQSKEKKKDSIEVSFEDFVKDKQENVFVYLPLDGKKVFIKKWKTAFTVLVEYEERPRLLYIFKCSKKEQQKQQVSGLRCYRFV